MTGGQRIQRTPSSSSACSREEIDNTLVAKDCNRFQQLSVVVAVKSDKGIEVLRCGLVGNFRKREILKPGLVLKNL